MSKRQASIRKSIEELQQQAADGDAEALCSLAFEYADDEFEKISREILKPNQRKAVRLYRLAAQKGNTSAMINLADHLETGRGVKKDPQEAFQWQKRAARQGDESAIFNVAITYRNVGKHRVAVQWFRKALAHGDDSADLELAKAELLGRGTRRNIDSGLRRLRKVAWCSTPYISVAEKEEAALTAARVFLDGWLVPRDVKTATRWLKKAAETGSEEALSILQDLESWDSDF